VDNNKQIKTRDGLTLRGREWPQEPARGTIVLVHGLGEHVGRYAHVAAFFNRRGWRIVGYDHRGHGESDGARGRIAEVDDLLVDLAGVIDAVRAEHPQGPLVLLGHSLGGVVAARFVAGALAPAAAWSRPIDALLLSSPALATAMNPLQKAMLAVLGPLTPNLAVSNALKPEWISRDPTVVAAYQADPRVHDRIAPRLARFIVDGGEFVRAVAARWTVPTRLLYAGAGGQRLLRGGGAEGRGRGARMAGPLPRDHERTRAGRGVIGLRRGARYTLSFAFEEPAMNARDPLLPLQADEAEQLGAFAERVWDDEIVPALTDYIAVPAKSPMFDPEWSQHGFIDRVVKDAAAWVEKQNVAGLKLEVIRLEGRTPVIFFDVPATRPGGNDPGAETICLYGHLDKQPEFNGWKSGFGPWTPRLENGLLYGRGGADDGYAIYASITAIKSLDLQGIPRP